MSELALDIFYEKVLVGNFQAHSEHYMKSDYKEHVIDLLQRDYTVNVETMNIIKKMEKKNE